MLPSPQPGQVIRYAYLWWNEARVGRENGTKDRPCSIVLTRITKAGHTVAYVLPITHTPPLKDEDGVERELNDMKARPTKAQTERRIFESLMPLTGRAVVSGSIQQNPPPSPDIKCVVQRASPLTVALVALDDRNHRDQQVLALSFFWWFLMPKLHQEQQIVNDLQHAADEQRP